MTTLMVRCMAQDEYPEEPQDLYWEGFRTGIGVTVVFVCFSLFLLGAVGYGFRHKEQQAFRAATTAEGVTYTYTVPADTNDKLPTKPAPGEFDFSGNPRVDEAWRRVAHDMPLEAAFVSEIRVSDNDEYQGWVYDRSNIINISLRSANGLSPLRLEALIVHELTHVVQQYDTTLMTLEARQREAYLAERHYTWRKETDSIAADARAWREAYETEAVRCAELQALLPAPTSTFGGRRRPKP